MKPGFRRRVLIEPSPGRVTAALEDDYHRMAVTLDHDGGVVIRVAATMERWPWTTCRGAIEQLATTFTGVAIAYLARRRERTHNCTHLHDLALFAAAHAEERRAVAYDIHVSDPAGGSRSARISRNAVPVLDWTLADEIFLAPPALAGRTLADLASVIGALDASEAEAMRMLRWACFLALGRTMTIPAGSSATAFPLGTCYTFQPERAPSAVRLAGAHVDFSGPEAAPLADRENMFA